MLKDKLVTSILKLAVMLFVVAANIACSSASKVKNGKKSFEQLDALMTAKDFEIISNWALPLATNSLNSLANAGLFQPGSTAGQISLIGNPNYVKIKGDSLLVYLPYFGERQMGGGYNNRGPGISFDGIPQQMVIKKNEEKERYDIRIKMKDRTESFNLTITIFPNFDTAINVNSSQRFSIRYAGSARAIPSED